jgi:hypothetical protein
LNETLSCGNYLKEETIQGRKLFKGGNYSREEIIQGRKLFAEIGSWFLP